MDCAYVEGISEEINCEGVLREAVCFQIVPLLIDDLHGLSRRINVLNANDWSECLVDHESHALVDVGDDCWFVESAHSVIILCLVTADCHKSSL